MDFVNQLTHSLVIQSGPNNRPMYAAKVFGSLSVSTEFTETEFIDVINVFYVFYSGHVFLRFLTF